MKSVIIFAVFFMLTTAISAQHLNQSATHGQASKNAMHLTKGDKYLELNQVMRKLWSDHMHWTLATVDAFFNEPKQLQVKLNRLLDNQKEIGSAIVPFYGQAGGDKLTKLLTEHIMGAVPVLKAAQNNDKTALDKSLADWYKNADEIAVFLSAANPKNWPEVDTKGALKSHITHTTEYAVNILKGEYTTSLKGFETALNHMLMLADLLTEGIAKQFPEKFKS
jgi:hypothetical protein